MERVNYFILEPVFVIKAKVIRYSSFDLSFYEYE